MSTTEHDHRKYQAEVEQRWGGTEPYRQSRKRTSAYTEADWAEVKAEMEAIEVAFAEAMEQGVEPSDEHAMAIAERARSHIDERYYACSHEMHVALADMYTADDRFKAHYDERSPGLAAYVAESIRANAARRPT